MDTTSTNYTNATIKHFKKITKFVFIITATNFWFEDTIPTIFDKIHSKVSKILDVIILIFVGTAIGAKYTQQNLTEKQSTDVIVNSIASFLVYSMYGFTVYNKDGIKELIFTLTVTLKELFNDEVVEKRMIKMTNLYLAGLMLVGCAHMVSYGVEGTVYALTSNATFTTIIPVWPDLEDRTSIAGFTRILIYFIWLFLAARIMSIYSIIVTISICLGRQFENLYEYFVSLNRIFDGDGNLGDKEAEYENALKNGFRMHCITLRCVTQLQTTCSVAYSGQVLMNVCVLLLLMIQMMQSERTLMELAPIVFMGTGVLVSSGLFIWSAGDITFYAERLPTAMFNSGWCHCSGQSSARVRKMVTIAMLEAQQPVVIKGLGIIELSYSSYVSIVKSSYSVFSVIY